MKKRRLLQLLGQLRQGVLSEFLCSGKSLFRLGPRQNTGQLTVVEILCLLFGPVFGLSVFLLFEAFSCLLVFLFEASLFGAVFRICVFR